MNGNGHGTKRYKTMCMHSEAHDTVSHSWDWAAWISPHVGSVWYDGITSLDQADTTVPKKNGRMPNLGSQVLALELRHPFIIDKLGYRRER